MVVPATAKSLINTLGSNPLIRASLSTSDGTDSAEDTERRKLRGPGAGVKTSRTTETRQQR